MEGSEYEVLSARAVDVEMDFVPRGRGRFSFQGGERRKGGWLNRKVRGIG